MDHHPVKSSRIASIAYDEALASSKSGFTTIARFAMKKVPERIYRLLQVVSKGRFMMASSKEIYRTPG